jgi:carbon storage regulator
MLVLTRKSEQSVVIGGSIEVKVLGVRGDQVSLGFVAPAEVAIYRREVYQAIQNANQEAARCGTDGLRGMQGALDRLRGRAAAAQSVP